VNSVLGGGGTVEGEAWMEEVGHLGCVFGGYILTSSFPVSAPLYFLSSMR
jgi:hypothetical protein